MSRIRHNFYLQIEREREIWIEIGGPTNGATITIHASMTPYPYPYIHIYMRFFFYIESFSLGAKLLSFYAWLLIAIRIETGGPTGNWRLKEFTDTT